VHGVYAGMYEVFEDDGYRAVSPSWSVFVYAERAGGRVEWRWGVVCLVFVLLLVAGVHIWWWVFADVRSDVVGSGGRGIGTGEGARKSVWRRRYGRSAVKRAARSSGG
jgi:hypothetical protein